MRAPSFYNLQVLPAIAPGCLMSDLVAIIGSLDFIMGEVDR
jgi:NADH-quinone oxidoreductase subunit D